MLRVARKQTSHLQAWLPRWFWPSLAAPGTLWLLVLFVVPFYVIVAVAFGGLDPIFLTPVPAYSPLDWRIEAFNSVVSQLFESGSVYRGALLRTFAYVGMATGLCLLVGYPVAYFLARHAGRFRAPFLIAFSAPFWISYMMRMLAWISLLQEDGYVNRILVESRLAEAPIPWLEGRPETVILGLVYGYIPFMVLPLFATLDRIDRSTLEAARDLGASPARTFIEVTLPLSRQAILAGCVIVSLPMFGDYYTTTLLAGTRDTRMVGNLVFSSIRTSLVSEGASLVLIVLLVLILPMLYYLRSTARARDLLG
jgi:ABC-type spermidine/putrescine transport system permease subunit I